MSHKIFITGCAKSGTTLLLRLFNYFKGVHVLIDKNSNEVTLEGLISSRYDVVVGKRKWNYILSEDLSESKLLAHKKIIMDNNIKIVNVIRDGRDVVLSDNFWVAPSRWISCIEQRSRFRDIINLEIKYEDIIYSPDKVQDRIATMFNLEAQHRFSKYPNNLDAGTFIKKGGTLYKARPIDDSSIHKDLQKYKDICQPDELLIFDELLKELNYI